MGMKRTITIEAPEEIALLLDRYPGLKKILEDSAITLVKEKMFKLALADELTRDTEVSEEEILELDKEVKRSLAEKYGISSRH